MRTVVAAFAVVAFATASCSSSSEPEPGNASAQAPPSPSPTPGSTASPDPADSVPQGQWKVRVSSDSSYYPREVSTQTVMIRIVCAAECVGTLQTETGVIRAVRWDGQTLDVRLPTEETGVARCIAAGGGLVDGTATMTVRRSQELPLTGSEPAQGMPTRLSGSYSERVQIDEQSRSCGFPARFTGRWSWELRSLDAVPDEGAA